MSVFFSYAISRFVMKKRTAQRRKSKKNHLYKYLLGIILFFVSIIFLGVYSLNKYFNQSFVSAYSDDFTPVAEDSFFSVLYIQVNDFDSDPVLVQKAHLSVFDRSTKKIFIYNIPLEYKVNIIGKYGKESLSKCFALASLESEDYISRGLSMFENTLFAITALRPDKYILAENEASDLFDQYWNKGKLVNLWNIGNISLIRNSVRTNMSIKDYSSVGKFVESLPEDRVIYKNIDLKDPDYADKFDEEIRDITFETYMSAGGKSISILNAAEQPGLANLGARAVRNLGGRVVAINNAQDVYNESLIITDLPSPDTTISLISKVFDIKNILNKKSASLYSQSEVDRSDIVVIIGIDKENYLY